MPGHRTHDGTHYGTQRTRIAIDGVPDLLIRALADRNQFHDPQGHADPTGPSRRQPGRSSACPGPAASRWPSGWRSGR
jgi:hypothetical protein